MEDTQTYKRTLSGSVSVRNAICSIRVASLWLISKRAVILYLQMRDEWHKHTVLTNKYRNFVPKKTNMEDFKKLFIEHSGFLKSNGITGRNQWRMLNKMLTEGAVVKIKRGLYHLTECKQDNNFIEVSHLIPCGVLCTFSAWFHYGLTTTIPHSANIAVPQNKKVALPDYPPIKLYYLSEKFYQLGITEIIIDNQPIKIYDLEKSVCDAIKFRNKVGIEITIEVVKNYLKRKDRNLDKLSKYARQMRISNYTENMIMSML